MNRVVISMIFLVVIGSSAWGQTGPSYSKDIRPFLSKYCVECHNAKTLKGSLNLETYKVMMDGSDTGPVVVAGQPDKSKLVLLTEKKEKPTMPPPKAKFHPTKDEVKLLRAWVTAGAKDDGANVKVELPTIKMKADVLPPVTAMSYSPRWKTLLFARNNRSFLVDLDKGIVESKELPPLEVKDRKITALKHVSNSGFLVAGLSETGKAGEIVTMASDDNYRPIGYKADSEHVDAISDVAVDAKGGRMASSSYDSTIYLWDFGRKSHVLKEHSDAVYGLAFSPDGKLLASVSADRAMKVSDVEKGKLLYTLGEATDWLYCVAWSADGKYLVSGGVDKSIRVYEVGNRPLTGLGSPKLRQSVFAHEGPVLKVVFSSDSKTLYSVGQDRVVKAWDIEKMVERKVYDKQPETVLCLALREDAGQIIVGRYDGIVQLIDMKTGKVAHEFGAVKKEGEKGRKGDGEKKNSSVVFEQKVAAPKLAQPAKIDGTLDRAGAVHSHRFDAKKDQQLGVQLVKPKDSKIDAVLTVSDKAGRVLAESHDGHLGVTFPAAGAYIIGVRDREYRGGAGFKYQLKLGEIPVVTAVFPLGMMRGENGHVHLEGVFLPKKTIPMTIPADAKPGQIIALPVGDGVLGKAQIIVGELPEVLAGGKMQVNSTANGRIRNDNQKDAWAFSAKKGQRLIVEVNARRLGSRLDSVIEILGQNDAPVPRAVLRSQAKTNVTFRDHDSTQGNIRIEAWSELGVNDFLFVGNELMRIQALPTHPDADCNFFNTQGQRIGFLDTTPTHHANNTPMYKVSLHPPGTSFPPNGYPVFTLYYKNDDGGPGFGRDSRLIFDPPADGEYKVRISDARGMGGVNFGYRLTVRLPKEHFKLKMSPQKASVSKGSAIPITLTAERIDGYDGPIKVSMSNFPEGYHMPSTVIEAGTYSTTVGLYAGSDAKPAAPGARGVLNGEGVASGLPFGAVEAVDLPTLIEPGDLVTTTVESEVSLKPGGQAKMLVKIERRNGFKGRVPLEVRGLPHGVRVLDIGLNGILVNENETSRLVVIYAEPWVRAQDHPFVVLAKREGKNTEHAAKSVMLKVK